MDLEFDDEYVDLFESDAELELMAEGDVEEDAPSLAALEAELEDEEAPLLSPEELDEAGFEIELMLEGDLLEQFEGDEVLIDEDEFGSFEDLEMAEAEISAELEQASLEGLVEAARSYPGLKITLSF